jgi:lysophospholipase L1-like esterase
MAGSFGEKSKVISGEEANCELLSCVTQAMSIKGTQQGPCPDWIKKFALAGVSACFVFLSAELLVRYMIPAWPFENPLYIPDYLSARDASLRWRFSSTGGRNSLGLRNREVAAKRPGTLRILFVGDSLVWSGETSSGELYTKVLEQRLNARSVASVNSFEVINAGIPGYTTYQELEFLKIYGLDMEPDLVILGFVFNDVYYKYLHKPISQKMLGREPTAHLHHFNSDTFPGYLFARSHLAHQIVSMSEMLWKRILGRPVFPFERRGDFYLAWKPHGWEYARALIREMRSLLRQKGVPLVVLVFPISDQVNHEYRKLDEAYVLYPQRKIHEICEDHGIPILDLTDTVYREGGVTLFRDYLHLNGKGNDVVANELEKNMVNLLELRS